MSDHGEPVFLRFATIGEQTANCQAQNDRLLGRAKLLTCFSRMNDALAYLIGGDYMQRGNYAWFRLCVVAFSISPVLWASQIARPTPPAGPKETLQSLSGKKTNQPRGKPTEQTQEDQAPSENTPSPETSAKPQTGTADAKSPQLFPCAKQLMEQQTSGQGNWAYDNTVPLEHSLNALAIASLVDGIITGVRVKAVCSDLLLAYPESTTTAPSGVNSQKGTGTAQELDSVKKWADSIDHLRALISAIDAGTPGQAGTPPPFVEDHVIQLFNNRNASEIASAVADKAITADEQIKKVGTDQLVVTGVPPGQETAIAETARYVALLDLPRPQVTLNVWSVEVSSDEPKPLEEASAKLLNSVDEANRKLMESLDQGWDSLLEQMKAQDGPDTFFHDSFYRYIAKRYIQCDQKFLSEKKNPTTEETNLACLNEDARRDWDTCPTQEYCLGYTQAFVKTRPSLTRLIFFLAASEHPTNVSAEIVKKMGTADDAACTNIPASTNKGNAGQSTPSLSFPCFRDQLNKSLSGDSLVLLRAALEDFLFQYKWSVNYPHDFIPYDLPHSANALDALLAPIVDAFNEDVAIFLSRLENQVQAKDFFGAKPGEKDVQTYSNGVITVVSISSQQASVETESKSAFDVTPPFTLGAYVDALEKAKNAGTELPTGLLAGSIVAALNTQKPAVARVGRGMSLTVTPTSLAAASSAELNITLDVKDDGNPDTVSGTIGADQKTNDDNVARVAEHKVQDVVRVDTLRLFDLSSFSASVGHVKPPFVVPGLGELPLFGGMFRYKHNKISKTYHRSFAIVSAVIVPSAFDLTGDMRFDFDRRVAVSAHDPGGYSLPFITSVADLAPDMRTQNRRRIECEIQLDFRNSKTACGPTSLGSAGKQQ